MNDKKTNAVDADLLKQALMSARDGIVIADALSEDKSLVFVNTGFERLTGYSADEAIGRNCRFLQGEGSDEKALSTLRNAIESETPCLVTLRNYRKDGSPFWNELSIAPVRTQTGEVTHFVGIQKDVTARVNAIARLSADRRRLQDTATELESLAVKDSVTGLFNRRYFEAALDAEWRRSEQQRRSIACFMFDVDEFSRYNQILGAVEGDRCLARLARVLGKLFSHNGDILARFGSEKFIALGVDVDAAHAVQRARQACLDVEAMGSEESTERSPIGVTISVGFTAFQPGDAFNARDLMEAASLALRDAKSQGRNRVGQALISADFSRYGER